MSSRIKLKTIAALAEVSISAVSRVLSNKGYVSPETRERVLNALAELTAQDTSAAAKQADVGLRIGLFLRKEFYVDGNPMTSVDVTTLIKAIESRGHFATLYDLEDPVDREAAAAAIEKKRLDAAIVDDDDTEDGVGAFLDRNGIPSLATNGHSADRACHYVDNDNAGGSRAAVEHLLDLGHTAIGFIVGRDDHWVSANRLEACRVSFADRGLAWVPARVETGYFKLNGGFRACATLLDRCPELTAIFAFNDLSAIGAIRSLRDRNLRVPEDVSVVGFDDMEIAAFSDPPLTTVSRFHPDQGNLLIRSLEDLVTYPDLVSLRILLKTRLIVRQSTMKRM